MLSHDFAHPAILSNPQIAVFVRITPSLEGGRSPQDQLDTSSLKVGGPDGFAGEPDSFDRALLVLPS